MKYFFRCIALSFLCLFSSNSISDTYNFAQIDHDSMVFMKTTFKYLKANPQQLKAYQSLLKEADIALTSKAESVTYKTLTPPSKSKKDYMSISRYWWPNKNTPNGLPWIRKDGKTNPSSQTDQVDRRRLAKMIRQVRYLALAYYFTEKEAYAKKGVEIIDTWFINESTSMNPNLKYAQLIPGKKGKNSFGILDGRGIGIYVLDAVKILKTSKFWNSDKESKFNLWVNRYLEWLVTSLQGNQAVEKLNNHGAWYLAHAASVAWYVNDVDTIKQMYRYATVLLDEQISKKSIFTHEIERSDSFFYSAFNLEALSRLSMVTAKLNMNLWKYKNSKGKKMLDALNYIKKYSKGDVKWPHSSKPSRISLMPNLFIQANLALDKEIYRDILKINPYQKTKFGKQSKYDLKQELERHILNPQKTY